MATTNLTNLKANALSNVVSTVLSTTGVSSVPKITTITYPGDDTAANTGGNQTISISGTGFNTGASVIVNGTPASVVSVVSPTSLTFTAPAQSSGTYTLYVVNTDGGTAIAVPGISYSGTPAWTTAAGSLATIYETAPVASVVDAAADVSVTYSLLSGTLPVGSSLNTATGLISGTSQATNSPTTYSFTIRATDGQNQDTDRAFSITINPDSVTWSSPADNSTTTVYEHSAISSITLASTSAAGKNIAYAANSLPTGITLTGNTISGTPTVTGTSYTQLTATAATTNRTATRNIGFVVNQDVVTWNSPADQYVTSLAQNSAMTTFNMDASSAAGKSITYTANSLPTGLSVSGATIVGTPTVTGNSGSLITATAATTGRTATRTFNWVVSVSGDTYWPYNVLLLNGETPSIPFNADASTNALAITVNGDTKPNYFNPYTPGYYSAYFDGTGDVYTIGGNAGPIGTEDFTWECYAYISTMGGDFPRIFESSTGVGGSFQIYLSGGTLVVGGNGTGTITSYSIAALTNQWLHLCITRTGSAMRIFVNGVLRAYSGSGGNNFPSGGSSWRTATEGGGIIGYLSNMRVVRGSIVSAYSTSSTTTGTTIFTPPTSPLTAISGTQFLGMQSARLIDTSSNNFVITTSGNTSVNSFDPFVLDSSYATYGSTLFDGTGDYLSIANNAAFNVGSENFTIEFWFYTTNLVANWYIFGKGDAATVAGSSFSFANFGTTWQIYYNTSSTLSLTQPAFITNQWTHIAVVRNGTTVTLYKDGVSTSTGNIGNGVVNATASPVYVGGYAGLTPFTGYISNFRMVKGTAVYTANFTPSTTPLTAIANTSLLTCQYNQPNNNNLFLDSSSATNIITRAGNATQGTFSPYGDDWSNYFDGTTDYITTPASASNQMTGNFTVEFWAYPTSIPAQAGLVGINNTTSSGGANFGIYLETNRNITFWVAGNGTTYSSSNTPITIGAWQHIAFVRSGSTNTVYVNGVSVLTNSATPSWSGTPVITVGRLFGDNTGVTFYGYLSNVRVVKGTALYTGPFIPSGQPLPVTSNTTMLLASTVGPSTADATRNHNIETFGTARQVANNSPYYDTYSAYFDGTGDYLSVPSNAAFVFGTGDFTIEAWVYLASGTTGTIFDNRTGTTSTHPVLYFPSSATTMQYYIAGAGAITSGSFTFLNRWVHVALCRASGSTRMFFNGVQTGSTYADTTNYSTSGTVYTGAGASPVGTNPLNGYISNLRVVKGTALYTTTFTPSTTPLTAVANTSLLTCQSNRFIDNSTNAFTITKTGDVKITAFEPFVGSNNSRFNSVYYAAKTDYLAVRPQPNVITFPGDFTFECWVYPTDTSLSTAWTIWDARQSGATAAAMTFGLNALASPVTGSWRLTYFNGTSYYGTGTVLWNQWTHVAWVRSGTTMTFYVNGVAGGTATISGTQTGTATTSPIYIGTKDNGLSGYGTVGYIADFRITNGAARTITLPTAPYDIK